MTYVNLFVCDKNYITSLTYVKKRTWLIPTIFTNSSASGGRNQLKVRAFSDEIESAKKSRRGGRNDGEGMEWNIRENSKNLRGRVRDNVGIYQPPFSHQWKQPPPRDSGMEKGSVYTTKLSSFSSLRERSAIPGNPAHVMDSPKGE